MLPCIEVNFLRMDFGVDFLVNFWMNFAPDFQVNFMWIFLCPESTTVSHFRGVENAYEIHSEIHVGILPALFDPGISGARGASKEVMRRQSLEDVAGALRATCGMRGQCAQGVAVDEAVDDWTPFVKQESGEHPRSFCAGLPLRPF